MHPRLTSHAPLVCALAAFAAGLPAGPLCAAEGKLNVLFLAVDDLRPELGCYGNKVVKSPNIDRLAKAGVRFERAYCQYPLCNPSRTSLLTGRYPTTTGVLDNRKHFRDADPKIVTLPQHFRDNGYVTARTGKVFHGGLDDQRSWTAGGEPVQPRKPRSPEDYRKASDRWVADTGDEKKLPDHRTATRAVELLEKYKDRPFFLAVGFVKPHSPLIAPKKYFDLYDPAKIPLPVDFAARPTVRPGAPAVALSPNGDLFIRRDASPGEAREMIRAYYACTSFVDAQVGRVLGALDRLKLRDRTVIVLWGDHGYHLGEKGKWSKHNSLYEVGVRVPLILAAPGYPGNGRASPRPVELIDLYPTLAQLCRLPRPRGVEGDSLVPLLKDPAADWSRPAFSVTARGKLLGTTVRTQRWRYTEWDAGKQGAELYDHDADPHELKNLAKEPGHAKTVAELKKLLHGRFKGR